MSRYHARSAAFDKDAGIKEVARQLAGLLGTGAEALASALAAVKKLGVESARKLLAALKGSLPGMDQGTRSRFAKAILTVALASSALMAQGCISGMTVGINADVGYREYRRRPHVVHVHRAGLPERDIRRIYVVHGGSRQRQRGRAPHLRSVRRIAPMPSERPYRGPTEVRTYD